MFKWVCFKSPGSSYVAVPCITLVYRKDEWHSAFQNADCLHGTCLTTLYIHNTLDNQFPYLLLILFFILCSMSGLNNEEYQVVIGNDTTSYIIDDLEPARNYSFYIVAYMPMGASRMSDQVSQHTLEDGKDRALRLPTFLAINHSW